MACWTGDRGVRVVAKPWFIMKGETRVGPFTHRGLVSLASNGQLSERDLVWCADLQSPIPAVCVAGLFPEPDDPVESESVPFPPSATVPSPPPVMEAAPVTPPQPVMEAAPVTPPQPVMEAPPP